ncbi:hypothetical protein HLB44_31405 [Aquincola sp. S2]|uniref:Uncharacterized protein n=1 Tax=Pseudaquabacterium terrae TaxID=2732868 RepID=A0ABX2ESI2_9BURK|nr:hypothetical protein [Aquabacterium terrae]NRF71504.1 hypothetical protein [Aquabacterium terrae]
MDTLACTAASGEPAPSASPALPPAQLDDLLLHAARRVTAILDVLRPHVSLVDSSAGPQMRIEPLNDGLSALSQGEISLVRDRMEAVNRAIRNGDIEIKPGLSSARIANQKAALDALVPGPFGEAIRTAALGGSVPEYLAVVNGQIFPPGVTIELTANETAALIVALGLGRGAVENLLKLAGVAPEVIVPLALAMIAATAAIIVCAALSPKRAVGFKVAVIGPIIAVIPYPA